MAAKGRIPGRGAQKIPGRRPPAKPVPQGLAAPTPSGRGKPSLLFLHQNFPGQYKHVARAFVQTGANVLALTDVVNKQPDIVPTVRYKHDTASTGKPHPLALNYAERIARGETVARAAMQLKRSGFTPDVIAGHFGWGETLLVKEVFPNAKLLTYAEFYYNATGSDMNFDPEFPEADEVQGRVKTVSKNAALVSAMAVTDRAQAPMKWQRDQFPDFLRSKIDVVHDGIDTGIVKPDPSAFVTLGRDGSLRLDAASEVITFVNRNLEPYRGYHIFMRALPRILAERPNARVVIVGGEGVSYGRAAPEGKTWKEIFLSEVRERIDMTRVHFVGKIPYNVFLNLLQISSAHVYLTYPFVLSWSMLEAMSMGCLVIGSDTPPVTEAIEHGKNGLLVPFFDPDRIAQTVIQALASQRAYDGLRKAARQTVIERYDLATVCLPRQRRLIEGLLG